MAIKIRLAEILEEREMTITELSEKANIAYRTALELRKGNSVRIDLSTMDKVCLALDIEPGDLFEFTKPTPKK